MDMLKLFEYLEDNELTPNQYYMLWSIYMKRKPKHINNSLEFRQLQNGQWIDAEYKLLDKAMAGLPRPTPAASTNAPKGLKIVGIRQRSAPAPTPSIPNYDVMSDDYEGE